MRRAGGAKKQPFGQADILAFERLVFFSDAVFAIAITLLVIELRLPETGTVTGSRELLAALGALAPRLVSFVVSFVVIGSLWLSHHRFFRMVRASDQGLLLLNLLFLLFVASLPFPTAVVGRYSAIPEAEALYAGWVAAAGLAKLGMWLHASRGRRLLPAEVGPAEAALANVRFAAPAVVFLLSVPLAWVHWVAPILAWNLAPLGYAAGRIIVRRKFPSRPAPRAAARLQGEPSAPHLASLLVEGPVDEGGELLGLRAEGLIGVHQQPRLQNAGRGARRQGRESLPGLPAPAEAPAWSADRGDREARPRTPLPAAVKCASSSRARNAGPFRSSKAFSMSALAHCGASADVDGGSRISASSRLPKALRAAASRLWADTGERLFHGRERKGFILYSAGHPPSPPQDAESTAAATRRPLARNSRTSAAPTGVCASVTRTARSMRRHSTCARRHGQSRGRAARALCLPVDTFRW